MNTLHKSALVLTIIGAITWGIMGIFKQNIIANMFGSESTLTRIIYIIVAIAGLINIGLFFIDLDYNHRH